MNNSIENYLSRAIAMQEFLNRNIAMWGTNAPIVAVKSEIDSRIVTVQTLDAATLKINKGITENKGRLRAVMTGMAMHLQAAVLAYAASVNNVVLLKSVGFSKSRIEHERDTVVYDLCKLIYDVSLPLETELLNFTIIHADFVNLENSLAAYGAIMQAPRGATSETKNNNAKMKEEMRKINYLISNKLNYLMLPYRDIEPDFYNTYKNVTIIVDLGKRKEKGTIIIKGKTIEFESAKAIANVRIWVEGIEDIKTNSNAEGNFDLTLKNSGTYVILAEKEGFYQSEGSLDVEEGNSYEINFELEPKVGEEVA